MGPLLALSFWALANAQQYMQQPDTVDTYLTKLEQCESGGKDITILDTNKKYSYAYFQFQRQTFDHFGKVYNLSHSDIHSRDQQYAIARAMIENGLWKNWYNCGKSVGLDTYTPPTLVE